MSRKTVRNGAKSAFKRKVGLNGPGGTAYARIGISGLALGSLTFGVGLAQAHNAPARKSSDQPAVPGKASKTQWRGFKATPMASRDMLPRNGAGLYAQNTAPPSSIIAAPSAKGQSSANTLAPIVVTGMRGSLLRSLAIKRESIGVVDAISAESIGQFPDSSVGGALAHLPGVTVNRGYLSSQAEGATVATGLPEGVNVNGFGGSFDTVLVNGRQIASGNGQTFNFSGIGAMYVGQIDVLKTPDMALSSGNIGSVINVKMLTPRSHGSSPR